MSIVGIDEVGRGPLAGPLVVGAVIFKKSAEKNQNWQATLKDSKKLTPKKREILAAEIQQKTYYALGWVSATELDNIGIVPALKLATTRAIYQLAVSNIPFSRIVIDGNLNFLEDTRFSSLATTLIKADNDIKQVSAASIIAKVARDNYMKELAEKFPDYGFEKHMGYGTKFHLDTIKKFGPCPEHRFSYAPIKYQFSRLSLENSFSISETPSSAQSDTSRAGHIKNTTLIGHSAETLVADYLKRHGHLIIAQNFRTKFYEIDIISQKGNCLYFTEVRCRKIGSKVTPIDTISVKKHTQITFAANKYLQNYNYSTENEKCQYSALAVAEVYHKNGQYTLKKWLPLD